MQNFELAYRMEEVVWDRILQVQKGRQGSVQEVAAGSCEQLYIT